MIPRGDAISWPLASHPSPLTSAKRFGPTPDPTRVRGVGWVERSEAHHTASGGPRTARPTLHRAICRYRCPRREGETGLKADGERCPITRATARGERLGLSRAVDLERYQGD